MDILALIGRVLFSDFYRRRNQAFPTARRIRFSGAVVERAVPKAAVAISGGAMLMGGLSVLLGLYGRVGALLLFGILIVITFLVHRPSVPENRMDFSRNLALAGAALLIAQFGTGSYSITNQWNEMRVLPPRKSPQPGDPTMNLLKSKIISVSIHASADRVYDFASNPENMPQWMPSFVRTVTKTGDGWPIRWPARWNLFSFREISLECLIIGSHCPRERRF